MPRLRSKASSIKKKNKQVVSAQPIANGVGIPDTFMESTVIENVRPSSDGGLYPVKWVTHEPFNVMADVFKDGHDHLAVHLAYQKKGEKAWHEIAMTRLENDAWQGSFTPMENWRYAYRIEAWVDRIATWLDHMEKKLAVKDSLDADLKEGMMLIRELRGNLSKADKHILDTWCQRLNENQISIDEISHILKHPEFRRLLKTPLRTRPVTFSRIYEVVVDRQRGLCGAWYEMFPRSQGSDPLRSGTFQDCIDRLPDIQRMGFDVVYLPPIHPIGETHRKGPNNTTGGGPETPGCPWAIGSPDGGHDAIHPQLGTMKDFEKFVKAAAQHDIEIALDFAAQCSPDHPYVKTHPEWFYHLPDGSIRYAENPPKKYQDIYPLNFLGEGRHTLWQEMKRVFLFWIGKGVKIFRVDNPHTKPLKFWEWLIQEIQGQHPEVVFLSEAFTRPKRMKFLAKAGFTQSYTYFTWRNAKAELREYMEELFLTDVRYTLRPNFFANTPDILHEFLQKGNAPAFKIRVFLAATLSASYGIYSGYELCENTPLKEGSEEYLGSEKYQITKRDWNAPGNIRDYIQLLNVARKENLALQQNLRFQFLETRNDSILAYMKWTWDFSHIVVAVVNLNPFETREDLLTLPLEVLGLEEWQTFEMRDYLSGEKYRWKGRDHYVRLGPQDPAHLFQLKR